MRGTKASPIHRRTKNPRAVQILLGHTKLERTVRYLAIEVEGALEMAEQTEAQPASRPRSAFALGPEAASDPKPASAQTGAYRRVEATGTARLKGRAALCGLAPARPLKPTRLEDVPTRRFSPDGGRLADAL